MHYTVVHILIYRPVRTITAVHIAMGELKYRHIPCHHSSYYGTYTRLFSALSPSVSGEVHQQGPQQSRLAAVSAAAGSAGTAVAAAGCGGSPGGRAAAVGVCWLAGPAAAAVAAALPGAASCPSLRHPAIKTTTHTININVLQRNELK